MVENKPTDEELLQFLKNEEKLWDMAAITSAATLLAYYGYDFELAAKESYQLADALMRERRKRLSEPRKY